MDHIYEHEQGLAESEYEGEEKQKPQVLVLAEAAAFEIHGYHMLNKFQVLKLWESPLPPEHYLRTHAQSVRALISPAHFPVTAHTLRLLPALRLIVTTSAGLDHLDLPACRSRGIAIACAGAIFSQDVADSAVGLLLDTLRKISASDRFVREGCWAVRGDYPLGSKLGGKRVGIVGFGSIGSEVAKRLEAFRCRIMYNSRKKKPFVSYPFYSDVRELAANCDVLVICCALTDQTHHMINKDVMMALGRDGFIINVGRGAIIDEKEMVRCLLQGEIAGAGLDVFENEPDVPRELFELDNVVMSPHNAFFTHESSAALCELVTGNLEAFFSNRPLLLQLKRTESINSSRTLLVVLLFAAVVQCKIFHMVLC